MAAHLIEAFLEMVAAERGAALNTLDAYRRDIEDYADFLSGSGRTPRDADAADVRAYLRSLDTRGFASSSTARSA